MKDLPDFEVVQIHNDHESLNINDVIRNVVDDFKSRGWWGIGAVSSQQSGAIYLIFEPSQEVSDDNVQALSESQEAQ